MAQVSMNPGHGIIVLLLVIGTRLLHAETVHLYVSPGGSDNNDGLSPSSPLQTLYKARDKLGDIHVNGREVYVELMAGYHDLTTSLTFSHGYPAPVTFRSYQHQEVHVTGGKRLPANKFTTVTNTSILNRIPNTAHGKVRQVDLKSVGITNYGKISMYGFYNKRIAPLEIFINSMPLRLAEWPNQNYINIDTIPDGRNGLVFTHNSSRDSQWAGETEPWAYGFWYWGWADQAVPIASFDPSHHKITLAKKNRYGFQKGSLKDVAMGGYHSQGGYFRVMNMLSELDQPGEYYLDRTTGILYLWPNTPTETLQDSDVIYVSLLDDCISLSKGTSNINFEDFTLEACRHFGINANGAKDIKIKNLEVRNTGSYGISCAGDCRDVTVSGCDIHHTDGGVYISGGNRAKLISSGNVVEHNHIWKFGRATKVGANAITPEGVNILMRYNYIHDCPYTGIRWAGNDHIIEYNHFSRCCYDSSDCGAIHAGRDWTMRGNIIRYNHVHDTIKRWPGADVRGIMLDDQYSSVTIERNVFYRNQIHTNVGGGRDNIIRYNVFYNATTASIQVDGRGMGKGNQGELDSHLHAMPYTSALWISRYPKLAAMANSSTRGYPEGNEIYRNVYHSIRRKEWIHFNGRINEEKYYKIYENKHSFSANDFTSPDFNDYTLQCSAKQWADAVDFHQPISLDKVGPQVPYGPKYLKQEIKHESHTITPASCTSGTVAPETDIPTGSYLPDGSAPNTLVTNITKEGCWLLVNSCPSHPDTHGTYRDTYGEQNKQAGTDEAKCLARAAKVWRYCGSVPKKPVTAVYGPTGAMTFGGDGCFFADYGCRDSRNRIERDNYAEQHENAAVDEESCLRRAAAQWVYCGKDRHKPYTSIFRPTGAVRTGGAGCWIKVSKCPQDSSVKYYFYDRWGATNLDTDFDEAECLNRAGYYWRQCGSHPEYPVTAYYRPKGREKTVPGA